MESSPFRFSLRVSVPGPRIPSGIPDGMAESPLDTNEAGVDEDFGVGPDVAAFPFPFPLRAAAAFADLNWAKDAPLAKRPAHCPWVGLHLEAERA